jgi:predicted nucleotidyltransferase
LTYVKTQNQGTNDNQIASTAFVQNEINAKKTIVGTVTIPITASIGETTLNIVGLGINPPIIINGDYSLNTAQVLGVKNVSTDNVIIYYSNAIDGNCKFNYTYSK